jgi:hypothetical protein
MCLADELAAASQKYKKHTCSVLPTYCSINQGDISLNIFLLILSMQSYLVSRWPCQQLSEKHLKILQLLLMLLWNNKKIDCNNEYFKAFSNFKIQNA